jgi:ubiquinone/menaquinone biosynthesis C-methylase UbiE
MDDLKQWLVGSSHATIFWKWYLLRSESKKYFDPECPLADYLVPCLENKQRIRICDIGAGAIPMIGYKYQDRQIEIVASDFHSERFNALLDLYRLNPPVRVEYQDATQLTYESNSFDIVHASNSLDHFLEPRKAILEMYRVCKAGGWIVLRHGIREGQRMQYRGMHIWNIESVGMDCKFWNRNGEEFMLSGIHPDFMSFVQIKMDHRRAHPGLILSKMKKPESNWAEQGLQALKDAGR